MAHGMVEDLKADDASGRCGPKAILAFIQHTTEVVQRIHAHFVFNMDGMGYEDWTDGTEKTCIVPEI
jgi:hypothetical protein